MPQESIHEPCPHFFFIFIYYLFILFITYYLIFYDYHLGVS